MTVESENQAVVAVFRSSDEEEREPLVILKRNAGGYSYLIATPEGFVKNVFINQLLHIGAGSSEPVERILTRNSLREEQKARLSQFESVDKDLSASSTSETLKNRAYRPLFERNYIFIFEDFDDSINLVLLREDIPLDFGKIRQVTIVKEDLSTEEIGFDSPIATIPHLYFAEIDKLPESLQELLQENELSFEIEMDEVCPPRKYYIRRYQYDFPTHAPDDDEDSESSELAETKRNPDSPSLPQPLTLSRLENFLRGLNFKVINNRHCQGGFWVLHTKEEFRDIEKILDENNVTYRYYPQGRSRKAGPQYEIDPYRRLI